jgi:hypothetical protein
VKKQLILFLVLIAISITAGMLMSDATWIGRVGITFLHKEYNFLKIWWQGAIALMLVYTALFYLQQRSGRYNRYIAITANSAILLLVAAGCYLSYDDLNHTFSHHLMGWHFRYGVYLFWVGWALICLFLIFTCDTTVVVAKDQDKTAT